MKKAKVPTVPGSEKLSKICKRKNLDIADEAGYPVLKSAFGGGGRGIRLANDEKQLRKSSKWRQQSYT